MVVSGGRWGWSSVAIAVADRGLVVGVGLNCL